MVDVPVLTTVITTIGALSGALGGVALTASFSERRETRAARTRQQDDRLAGRKQAYDELLGAAARLRVHLLTTCQRHWTNMNVRLDAVEDLAAQVSTNAYKAAMQSPALVAAAALELGEGASQLAAWAAGNADLGDYSGPDNQFLAGEMTVKPDLSQFDRQIAGFWQLAAEALGAGGQKTGGQGTRPGASGQDDVIAA